MLRIQRRSHAQTGIGHEVGVDLRRVNLAPRQLLHKGGTSEAEWEGIGRLNRYGYGLAPFQPGTATRWSNFGTWLRRKAFYSNVPAAAQLNKPVKVVLYSRTRQE